MTTQTSPSDLNEDCIIDTPLKNLLAADNWVPTPATTRKFQVDQTPPERNVVIPFKDFAFSDLPPSIKKLFRNYAERIAKQKFRESKKRDRIQDLERMILLFEFPNEIKSKIAFYKDDDDLYKQCGKYHLQKVLDEAKTSLESIRQQYQEIKKEFKDKLKALNYGTSESFDFSRYKVDFTRIVDEFIRKWNLLHVDRESKKVLKETKSKAHKENFENAAGKKKKQLQTTSTKPKTSKEERKKPRSASRNGKRPNTSGKQ